MGLISLPIPIFLYSYFQIIRISNNMKEAILVYPLLVKLNFWVGIK